MRQEVFEENEQIADMFGEISPLLTTEQMQQLNLEVDVNGVPPEEVAETFLRDNGLIG
jgi:osmoprotectant transport system substrate-binding protein